MGKKILLADDSITIQKVIELTFSDEDFDVVTVGNGRLAMEKVQDVRPDLVLCDIIMPEKDGYEVCEFIKKHPTLSHIPVLLLTGAFEPFDQERANRVGCDGFLAKPFEPQTLIAKVKELLDRAGAQTMVPSAAPAPPLAAATASSAVTTAHEQPPSAPAAASATPATAKWSAPAPGPPASASFFGDEEFDKQPSPPAAPAGAFPPARESAQPGFASAALSFEDFGGPADEEQAATTPRASDAAGFDAELYPAEEGIRDDLLPMTSEEASTLGGPAVEKAPAPAAAWGELTIEVPLEERAQASVEARVETESLFEEVFEEPSLPPAAAASMPPVPEGEPVFEPEPEPVVPRPATAAPYVPPPSAPARGAAESFGDITPRPREEAAPPASEAAQVAVPTDMVAQIAQRVVGQISEKVIREIAWEVIPDLAEVIIRQEIERLKTELG